MAKPHPSFWMQDLTKQRNTQTHVLLITTTFFFILTNLYIQSRSDLLICVVNSSAVFWAIVYKPNKPFKYKKTEYLQLILWAAPHDQSEVVNVHNSYCAKLWLCWNLTASISSITLELPTYWLYFLYFTDVVISKNTWLSNIWFVILNLLIFYIGKRKKNK